MAEKLPELLVFLGRNTVTFFTPKNNFAKALNIPETAVKDLEVVDPNLLGSEIRGFLEKEKISATRTIVIISDPISFTRDIPLSEENKKGILVQDFIDNIPLESPEVKVFKENELNKAVAVNPKYYEVIIESLTAKGFTIFGVVPAIVIPEIRILPAITVDIAKKVIDNFGKIKYQNFVDVTLPAQQGVSQGIITKEKPKGPRIWLLLGIFGLMILILVVMLLLRK